MIHWHTKSIHIQKNNSEMSINLHFTLTELCDILYKLNDEETKEIIIEVLNNSPKEIWEKIKEAMKESI